MCGLFWVKKKILVKHLFAGLSNSQSIRSPLLSGLSSQGERTVQSRNAHSRSCLGCMVPSLLLNIERDSSFLTASLGERMQAILRKRYQCSCEMAPPVGLSQRRGIWEVLWNRDSLKEAWKGQEGSKIHSRESKASVEVRCHANFVYSSSIRIDQACCKFSQYCNKPVNATKW